MYVFKNVYIRYIDNKYFWIIQNLTKVIIKFSCHDYLQINLKYYLYLPIFFDTFLWYELLLTFKILMIF